MATLQLSFLGPPRIVADSADIEIPARKALALLAYLAVTARPHGRASLATLLWPNADPTHARGSLRYTLGELRDAIGSEWLTADAEVIRLRAPDDASLGLDVIAFRAEAAQVRAHGHNAGLPCPACLAHLTHAAELWRGEFLAGLSLPDAPDFEEWRFFEAEALRREAGDVLERLTAAQAARGDLAAATDSARRWLGLDPLHEPAHRALMRLYAQAGSRNAALRQYRECARILAAELQIGPDAETEALHAQILAGWPNTPAANRATVIPDVVAPPAFLRDDAPAPSLPPFVGRAEQLDRLHAGLRRSLTGRGEVLFVTGEAGAGKTSLLRAFVRQALDAHPDLLVGFGACSALAGMGDPYQPFREALVMLTGDLIGPLASGLITKGHAVRLWQAAPETLSALVEHGPALIPALLSGESLRERAASALRPGDATLSRLHRLVEAGEAAGGNGLAQLCGQYGDVLHALAARGPVLLVLDDLQWSDPGSSGLLFLLSRALADTRVCIVGAFRPEEVTLDGRGPHAMAKVGAEIRGRDGKSDVTLDHIEPDARRAFIDALLDTEPNALDDRFRTALLDHTEGHALFTVETLRTLHERGQLVATDGRGWVATGNLDWSAIPTRVSGVIEERLERLSPTHMRLLDAACVEGEHFTAQVAALVAGLDERSALHDLEHELSRAHAMVTYEGPITVADRVLDHFRFRHNLFQRSLYDRLGPGERRLLHGEVGAALETLYDARDAELAPNLAWHFEQAEDAKHAIPYLLRAGDRARLTYAHDAAIGFYRRAATLLEQEKDEDGLARTLMRLALTQYGNFDYDTASHTYSVAFEAWNRSRGEQRAVTSPLQCFHGVLDYGITPKALVPMLYRGLVQASADLEVLPDIAESWEVDRGGARYIFRLRSDARWSDGSPVVAEDYEQCWKALLRPGALQRAARLLYDIRGAEAYHMGGASGPDSIGLWSRDAHTLVIDLEHPAAYFLHLLTSESLLPIPVSLMADLTEPPKCPEAWRVNGPFIVQEYQPGRVRLVRNPEFRGYASGNVGELEFLEYLDYTRTQSDGLDWYEANIIDALEIWNYPVEIKEVALRRHGKELLEAQTAQTMGMAFDVTQPPFDDVRVRRAFCHGFDVKRHSREFIQAQTGATGGWVPPGLPGHSQGIALPFDPALAHALLAEAGYADRSDFPRFTRMGVMSPGSVQATRYINAQFKEHLGLDAQYDKHILPARTWTPAMHESSGPIGSYFWVHHTGVYPDPDSFLRIGYDTLIRNHNGWQDPEYDRLINEARILSDHAARMRLYRRADAMLIEAAAVQPWLYGESQRLVKPWIKWLPIPLVGSPQYQHTIIEPH